MKVLIWLLAVAAIWAVVTAIVYGMWVTPISLGRMATVALYGGAGMAMIFGLSWLVVVFWRSFLVLAAVAAIGYGLWRVLL